MKRIVTVVLAWSMLLVWSLAGAANVVEGPPSCAQCGMDRTAFAHSRVLLTYDDGATAGLCSIHCAALDMKQHEGRKVISFMVADYGTRELIDARKAIWVIGGNIAGVMTDTAKWAFAKEEDAKKFMADNGGQRATYEQAFKAAQDETNSGMACHHECHGPGGLMQFNPAFGDDIYHNHPAGMWMFNYKYMHMAMDGLRYGSTNVPTASVGNNRGLPYDDYMMIPTEMTMDMHMVMAMYGINDKITVMGMLNYLETDMDMLMDMSPMKMVNGAMVARGAGDTGISEDSPMKSSGIGDTEVRGIYKLSDFFNASLGLSLPTGDIDQDYVPMPRDGAVWRMPYDMQLGSGTFDLKPALTYSRLSSDSLWNWGGQAMAILHLGQNANDYSLGDSLKLNTWLQRALGPAATWLRFAYSNTGSIHGHDPAIQKAIDDRNGSNALLRYMAPTMPDVDPNNYGGQRLDGFVGVSVPMGIFSLGIEGGVPLYQNLNGLQMKNDWYLTAGLQAMF